MEQNREPLPPRKYDVFVSLHIFLDRPLELQNPRFVVSPLPKDFLENHPSNYNQGHCYMVTCLAYTAGEACDAVGKSLTYWADLYFPGRNMERRFNLINPEVHYALPSSGV